LFLIFRLSKTKKYAAYDHFHGNGPYGEIPTRKEPIRTHGFSLPYNKINYYTSVCYLGGYFPNDFTQHNQSVKVHGREAGKVLW